MENRAVKIFYAIILLCFSCKTNQHSNPVNLENPKNPTEDIGGTDPLPPQDPGENQVKDFKIDPVPGAKGVAGITPVLKDPNQGWQESKTCPDDMNPSEPVCTYGIVPTIPTFTVLGPGKTSTSLRTCIPSSISATGKTSCSQWTASKSFESDAATALITARVGYALVKSYQILREKIAFRSSLKTLEDNVSACPNYDKNRLSKVVALQKTPESDLENVLKDINNEPTLASTGVIVEEDPDYETSSSHSAYKPENFLLEWHKPTAKSLDLGEFASGGHYQDNLSKPVLISEDEFTKSQADFNDITVRMNSLTARMQAFHPSAVPSVSGVRSELQKLKSLKDEFQNIMRQSLTEYGSSLQAILNRPRTYNEKLDNLISDFIAKHSIYDSKQLGYKEINQLNTERAHYGEDLDQNEYEELEKKIISLDQKLTAFKEKQRLQMMNDFKKEFEIFIHTASELVVSGMDELETESKIRDQYIADIKRSRTVVLNTLDDHSTLEDLKKAYFEFRTNLLSKQTKSKIDLSTLEGKKALIDQSVEKTKNSLLQLNLSPEEFSKAEQEIDSFKTVMGEAILNASTVEAVNERVATFKDFLVGLVEKAEGKALQDKKNQEMARRRRILSEKIGAMQSGVSKPRMTTSRPIQTEVKPEPSPQTKENAKAVQQELTEVLSKRAALVETVVEALTSKGLGLITSCEDNAYNQFAQAMQTQSQKISDLAKQRDQTLSSIQSPE